MGRGVKVDWQESSEELKQLYRKEVHPPTAYPTASPLAAAPGETGSGCGGVDRSILPQRATVAQVVSTSWTWRSPETSGRASGQGQKALSKPAAAKGPGGQGTTGPVPNGLGRQWSGYRVAGGGVSYTYKGRYSLMKGHGLGLKVPRPHSEKADAKQRMAWKRGPTECPEPGRNDYQFSTMPL